MRRYTFAALALAFAWYGIGPGKSTSEAAAGTGRSVVTADVSHYANGRIPAAALCPIGQGAHRLRCDAARDFRRLSTAYKAHFGGPLTVTDSYRSYAGQVQCRRAKGSLCAVPGTSNHGLGRAVDVDGQAHLCGTRQHRWLEDHARTYGWLWPSWARPGTGSKGRAGECWHIQYKTNT